MTDACYVWNKVHTVNTWSTWFGTHLVKNNKIYGQKICQTPKNVKTYKYTWSVTHLTKEAVYELPKHCVSV